jgi:hypothetical protein
LAVVILQALVAQGCKPCLPNLQKTNNSHGNQWDSNILGIVILQAFVAQFVEKLIVFLENNEIQTFWEL